jgi:hypothetical protein
VALLAGEIALLDRPQRSGPAKNFNIVWDARSAQTCSPP